MKLTATQLIAMYLVAIPAGEFPTGGVSSGELYARMMAEGVDLNLHHGLLALLASGKATKDGKPLLRVSNHYVTLTAEGAETKQKVEAALTEPTNPTV